MYPHQWKLRKVKAIPKKENSSEMGNYRLISLLSIPNRIYESIIAEGMHRHFTDGKTCEQSAQWDFVTGKSTEFLMLHLTEERRKALDEKKHLGIIFIDVKKAFDSLCHKTMALKLQACGISGNLYNLIIDYLMNRKQYDYRD